MLQELTKSLLAPEGFVIPNTAFSAHFPQTAWREISTDDLRYQYAAPYFPATDAQDVQGQFEAICYPASEVDYQFAPKLYPILEEAIDSEHILRYFVGKFHVDISLKEGLFSDLTESYHVDERIVGQKTLKQTREVLVRLTGHPLSQVTSSDDGEVAFYWFNEGNKVDAYLDSDGFFTWIGKFDGRYERGGDGRWQNKLPSAFVEMLNRLFR